jgi:hypothetical protein
MTTIAASETKDESDARRELKDVSLKAAGYAYIAGDVAIVASGLLDKNKTKQERWQRASVGLLWGAGGLAAARYGNPKGEKQLELLTGRLRQYLKKQGVAVPKDITELHKDQSIFDHIEAFLYAHPSEVLNAIYTIGAGQMVLSGVTGLKRAAEVTHKKTRREAKFDIASGILIGAGALAGLLIPEKKREPDHPTHGALEKAMSWVQEKPLRLSGILYHANNMTMLGSAFAACKENPESNHYLWRFLTAGSYIFANTMLAISSKGHTKDKNYDVTGKLADLSAQVIAAQPPEVQKALVEQVSGYLAAQPEIDKKADEIAELLHIKLSGAQKLQPTIAKWQNSLYTMPKSETRTI